MKPTKIPISKIDASRFRDFEILPLDKAKVDEIAASMQETGDWGGIHVRPRKDGRFEQAFGHHRLAAMKQVFGPDHLTECFVGDYDDQRMIQMMNFENVEDAAQPTIAILMMGAAAAYRELERMLFVRFEGNGDCAVGFDWDQQEAWKTGRIKQDDISLYLYNDPRAKRAALAPIIIHLRSQSPLYQRRMKEQVDEARGYGDEAVALAGYNPEATKHFQRPAHLMAFQRAVIEAGETIPFDEQPAVAERVMKSLKQRSGGLQPDHIGGTFTGNSTPPEQILTVENIDRSVKEIAKQRGYVEDETRRLANLCATLSTEMAVAYRFLQRVRKEWDDISTISRAEQARRFFRDWPEFVALAAEVAEYTIAGKVPLPASSTKPEGKIIDG